MQLSNPSDSDLVALKNAVHIAIRHVGKRWRMVTNDYDSVESYLMYYGCKSLKYYDPTKTESTLEYWMVGNCIKMVYRYMRDYGRSKQNSQIHLCPTKLYEIESKPDTSMAEIDPEILELARLRVIRNTLVDGKVPNASMRYKYKTLYDKLKAKYYGNSRSANAIE